MNLSDYSLEKLARVYAGDREADPRRRMARVESDAHRFAAGSAFMALLAWWLRLTALIVRYPVDPVRIGPRLAAIGLPAGIIGEHRAGGDEHVGR